MQCPSFRFLVVLVFNPTIRPVNNSHERIDDRYRRDNKRQPIQLRRPAREANASSRMTIPCIFRIIRIKDNVQLRADRGAKLPPTFDVTLTDRLSGVRNWTTGNEPSWSFAAAIVLVIHYVTRPHAARPLRMRSIYRRTFLAARRKYTPLNQGNEYANSGALQIMGTHPLASSLHPATTPILPFSTCAGLAATDRRHVIGGQPRQGFGDEPQIRSPGGQYRPPTHNRRSAPVERWGWRSGRPSEVA